MTNHTTIVSSMQYPLYRDVLMTLLALTSPLHDCYSLPPPESWVSTRQIADANNISIYKARLLLLVLVDLELVMVSDGPINKSLRWYPKNNKASLHGSLPDIPKHL